MDFITKRDVPIVSTGTYQLGSGEATFTPEDLASAVAAASDPTVRAPRIKIGHEDPRFADIADQLDGEPAMGSLENLTLSDDGHTILADLANMPKWLGDGIETYYPNRSIEGGFNYAAPSGKDYKLVISNLALLGTTHPGVGSLPDLRELLEKNGPVAAEPTAASGAFEFSDGKAERFVMAKVGQRTKVERETMASRGEAMSDGSFPIGNVAELKAAIGQARTPAQRLFTMQRAKRLDQDGVIPETWNSDGSLKAKAPVAASVDLGAMPRRFAADVAAGKVPKVGDAAQDAWWARSVEAADEGALSIVVDTGDSLMRVPLTVTDKDVSYGTPEPIAAASGNLTTDLTGPRVLASYPSKPTPETKTMKLNGSDVDQVAVAKSLGLADDADEKIILAKLGVTGVKPEPTPVAASLPEGVVVIDKGALDELQANAKAGADVAKTLAEAARDKDITDAIGEGRIAASQRKTWRERYDNAPEETKILLRAKVEEGGLASVIPVAAREVGTAGEGGEQTLAASAPRFLPENQPATTEAR